MDIEGLGALQLLDTDGRSRRLGDLWRDSTVVLALLRHFG